MLAVLLRRLAVRLVVGGVSEVLSVGLSANRSLLEEEPEGASSGTGGALSLAVRDPKNVTPPRCRTDEPSLLALGNFQREARLFCCLTFQYRIIIMTVVRKIAPKTGTSTKKTTGYHVSSKTGGL